MAGPLQWNFSIDNTSPMFTYLPYSDTQSTSGWGDGLLNGWQTWYTGSNFLTQLGALPKGESFHLTSLPGASVSLSFFGTGISFFGQGNSSFDVTIDGSLVSNPSTVQGALFTKSDLSAGVHNVTLTVRPDNDNQVFSLRQATITSVVNSSVNTPTTLVIDNQNTSAITYLGSWIPDKTASGVPSSSSTAPFHTTSDQGASAFLNFTGRSVAVYGSSTSGHGLYSINLNGEERTLNGSSTWLLGDMLMFYQDGLDVNSTHTLNITNLSDEESVSLSRVEVKQFSASSSSSANSSKSVNSGAIVGPIIAALLLLGLVALYLYLKRREKRKGIRRKENYRSSVATSIFLPDRFRRRNNLGNEDVSPYTYWPEERRSFSSMEMDSGDLDARSSRRRLIEKRENTALTSSRINEVFDVSRVPMPSRPERSVPRSVPTSVNPFESNLSDTSSPHIHDNTSAMRTDDPRVIERVLELVSQRIDTQRYGPDANHNLPPYRESV